MRGLMSCIVMRKPEPSLASGEASPVWWEDEPVKWVARRSRQARAGAAAAADDGLDGPNWDLLLESVAAAHRGDAEAHVAPLRRLGHEVPADAKAGAYLWYLLRYQVAVLLGRKPSAEDLHELAVRFYPGFARLIRGDESRLEDTFLTVFGLAPEDRKVRGGVGVVMGSAALGVLLNDPEAELAEMRPHLAKWWRANAEEFRDLGAR